MSIIHLTIILNKKQYERLKVLAEAESISLLEIIREY